MLPMYRCPIRRSMDARALTRLLAWKEKAGAFPGVSLDSQVQAQSSEAAAVRTTALLLFKTLVCFFV